MTADMEFPQTAVRCCKMFILSDYNIIIMRYLRMGLQAGRGRKEQSVLELAVLLTIGYLGGRFQSVAWIFLSSALVLVTAPFYLVERMGIASPLALVCLTLIAIAAIQSGSLTGLLKTHHQPD